MASQNLFYQQSERDCACAPMDDRRIETFECEPSGRPTIHDILLKTQTVVEEIQCEVNAIHSDLFGQVNDSPTPPIGKPGCALDVIMHNLDNLVHINDILKNINDRL